METDLSVHDQPLTGAEWHRSHSVLPLSMVGEAINSAMVESSRVGGDQEGVG